MTLSAGLTVLMTTDIVGGVWTYALDLSRELARVGTRIWMAAMGGCPTEAQRREARSIPSLHVFFQDLRLEWMDEPWGDVAAAGEWLLEFERLVRPDVVHLNNYCHGALPWRAPVLMVGHSCVLSWWEAVHGAPAPERYARYQHEVTRGMAAAARLVAPTHAMLLALHKHYGEHPDSQVIPNGTAMPVHAVRRDNYVLCAARLWDEAKNAAALARAAAGLPWPVQLAGDAIHPTTGKAVAFPNVHVLGRLDRSQMARWYSRASIYALPARYEPFGLSIAEAARAGCALVLGDIPSLRETWDGAACFVHPDDTTGLHACLAELIADRTAREEWSQKARARSACLGAAWMAHRYLRAYQELTAAAPTAHSAA